MNVEWISDSKMETFSANWDNVLSGCHMEIPEEIQRTLLLKQIRKSGLLKADVAYYDRLPKDHPEKTYRFLRETVRRQVALRRMEANQPAHSQATQAGADITALAAAEKPWRRGKRQRRMGASPGSGGQRWKR